MRSGDSVLFHELSYPSIEKFGALYFLFTLNPIADFNRIDVRYLPIYIDIGPFDSRRRRDIPPGPHIGGNEFFECCRAGPRDICFAIGWAMTIGTAL